TPDRLRRPFALECAAHYRGAYFSNFGSLGSIASHGYASDVQISYCGLYKLGSSKVPAAIPCRNRSCRQTIASRNPDKNRARCHPSFRWLCEVFRRALGNFESLRRDVENRSVPSAGCFLAVAAVTVECNNRFRRNFITNRAAGAATCNRFHFGTLN